MRAPILFVIVLAIHGMAISGFFLMQGCATRPPRVPVARTENVQLPPNANTGTARSSQTAKTQSREVVAQPVASAARTSSARTATSTKTGRSLKMPPTRAAAGSGQVKPMTTVKPSTAGSVAATSVKTKPYTPKLSAATVPVSAPRRSAIDTSGATVYKVKKGDMLSKIAYSNGISTKELAEYNNLPNANSLRVDQKILIPPYARAQKASTGSTTAKATRTTKQVSAPKAGSGNSYVVQKGDHLTGIARKHGVTISALRSANNMTNDRIIAGKPLIIPAGGVVVAAKKPATFTPPPVKLQGATKRPPVVTTAKRPPAISGIKRVPTPSGTKINTVTVGTKNNVKDPTIINSPLGKPAVTQAGPGVIKVPPVVQPKPAAAPAPAKGALEQAFEYVVQDGESLDDIARAFIVSADDVRKLNALPAGAKVKPGQTLKIPPSIF